MHTSAFHTHYNRMCKSLTTLKRENKLQNHTILFVDLKKKYLQREIPNFTSKQSQSASHYYQWHGAALPVSVTRWISLTVYFPIIVFNVKC